jgi:hypothetical protein
MDPGHSIEASDLAMVWKGDAVAATTLYRGDVSEALARVNSLAKALSGPNPAKTRLELLGSSLAAAKMQETALAALVVHLVKTKDVTAAAAVGRVLKLTTDRVARLAEAHAATEARAQRAVVVAVTPDKIQVGVRG